MSSELKGEGAIPDGLSPCCGDELEREDDDEVERSSFITRYRCSKCDKTFIEYYECKNWREET